MKFNNHKQKHKLNNQNEKRRKKKKNNFHKQNLLLILDFENGKGKEGTQKI